MWQDIVDQKERWIGGKLIDYGDHMDRVIFAKNGKFTPMETTITGFNLTEKWFGVVGEDFECGGLRDIVGLVNVKVQNGLAFVGYGGHRWDIVQPTVVNT